MNKFKIIMFWLVVNLFLSFIGCNKGGYNEINHVQASPVAVDENNSCITKKKTISKYYVDEDEINILKKVETKDGFFCSKNTLEKYKNLEWIDVSQNNPQYSSKEGILYSKDGSELLYCPPKYKGNVNIEEHTTSINLLAFAHCTNVESYVVADTNQYLESENGSLFSKGKQILHYVPDNRTGVYIISKEVEKIDDFAFIGSSVEEVIFEERDTILKYDGLNFSESKTLKRMIFEAGSEKYVKETGVIWWHKPNGLVWTDGPIVRNIENYVFVNKNKCAEFIAKNQEIIDFLVEAYDDKKKYSVAKNKGKIKAVRGEVFIDNSERIEKWKALFDALDCKFVLVTGKGENREMEIYLGAFKCGEKSRSEKLIFSKKEIPGAESIVDDWYFATVDTES